MMRRTAVALGLFLTPLAGWAAYNQIPPGVVVQSNLGTNVFTYLANAADSATGFVSGNALATGVQTALGQALDAAGGLVSYSSLAADVKTALSMSASVATAIQNATNAANGIIVINSSGFAPSVDKVGVSTNSNAAAGNIGEVIASLGQPTAGGGLSLTTGTAADLTSVTLSAGDWNCWGSATTLPSGATMTGLDAWISPVPNAIPGTGLDGGALNFSPGGLNTIVQTVYPTGTLRITCTSSVCTDAAGKTNSALTVYVATEANFSGGTMKGVGSISCRRMR